MEEKRKRRARNIMAKKIRKKESDAKWAVHAI